MSYTDTFIRVASDCPVTSSTVPESKKATKPIHVLQYELLSQHPYHYTHEDLIFEVHIRHKGIDAQVIRLRGEELRAELFSKPHPCLRASMLPKKFGWGIHYDAEGKIAIYGMESVEYQRFLQTDDGSVKLLPAMRNSRK
ncbi:DUF6157 family protein [Paenibacillus sp. MER TA 81-3]|uniref:DUF6157 family protein n=1 Tax=Paenibacillus sp. MER TA 81-3 TaxID=2939573 RepID=UPI00203EE1A8|nr:DUF6157 family protein [Paenibacillus sp. MER TA 81-3]MCM3342467.1 DUF6157 family protein [Paenibacillus sp. MER TA 81-3]